MDILKLKKLIALVRKTGIAELEISDNEERVRITNSLSQSQTKNVEHVLPSSVTPSINVEGNNVISKSSDNTSTVSNKRRGNVIYAPMVGTFYRASSPNASPLVELGQKINVGDKVCIIEAMKLMNEIESEYEGVVSEILVRNEEPVEYGEELFVIT